MLQLPALGENQEETAWKYLGNDQEKCGAPLLLDSPPKQRGQSGGGGCMGWGLLLRRMFGTASMELSACAAR